MFECLVFVVGIFSRWHHLLAIITGTKFIIIWSDWMVSDMQEVIEILQGSRIFQSNGTIWRTKAEKSLSTTVQWKSCATKLKRSSHSHVRQNSQFRVFCGILDFLGERVWITADTGADCIHATHWGEVKALFCYEINWCSNLKVLVQVLKVLQHIGVL